MNVLRLRPVVGAWRVSTCCLLVCQSKILHYKWTIGLGPFATVGESCDICKPKVMHILAMLLMQILCSELMSLVVIATWENLGTMFQCCCSGTARLLLQLANIIKLVNCPFLLPSSRFSMSAAPSIMTFLRLLLTQSLISPVRRPPLAFVVSILASLSVYNWVVCTTVVC